MLKSLYSLIEPTGEVLLVILLCWLIIDSFGVGVPPPIPGVFIIPGYPIVGNAFQLRRNPAQVFIRWSKKYNASLFQIRLGYKRILIVNSFEDAKELWINHSLSVNSRPVAYTFHGIVSANQGATIGSTPAGKDLVRKKKHISQSLNKKSVDQLASVLDAETKFTIEKILVENIELHCEPSNNHFRNINTKFSDVNLLRYGQLFSLRTSLFITYGIHIDCYRRDKELAKEIITVENKIINFRSPISNVQDYLPMLRWWPLSTLTNSEKAKGWRDRRDLYMGRLMKTTINKITNGEPNACDSMMGKIILNKVDYTQSEINSICLTMVSAGLDNTSLTFEHIMGHLSQPKYGNNIQEIAYYELMNQSGNDILVAWDEAAAYMDCDYVKAIVQEGLRFFTVLPLSLPRTTTKDLSFNTIKRSTTLETRIYVPKGSTLFLNAFAVNHDEIVFPNPYQFLPERWLDKETGKFLNTKNFLHFAFGAGSRKCSGTHLAFRELYTLIARMILMFKIKTPVDSSMIMELDPFINNSHPSATSFEPKEFKVRLKQRMNKDSDKLYRYIIDRK